MDDTAENQPGMADCGHDGPKELFNYLYSCPDCREQAGDYAWAAEDGARRAGINVWW